MIDREAMMNKAADDLYQSWCNLAASLMDAGAARADEQLRRRMLADTFVEAAGMFTPQPDDKITVQSPSKAVRG
jgi:hypothetical protein